MKNLLAKSAGMPATLLFMLCSLNVVAANHVTMGIENCVQTGPNTMTVDLYILNDDLTLDSLNAISYGLNVNAAILNGGKLSWALLDSSGLNSNISGTFSYGWNVKLNQLKLTSLPLLQRSQANPLPVGVKVKVGRFKITNTANWAKAATNFSLNTTAGSGNSNTGAVVYITNALLANVNTSETRAVSVSCSISLH